MKFFVLLGDGMADDPVKELGNQTPLQKANKPVMDHMAKYAELGLDKDSARSSESARKRHCEHVRARL